MVHLNDLKDLIMYKKTFYLPINKEDKLKDSLIMLLTPNIESTIDTLNNKLIINKYHKAYYLEKNVSIYINSDGSISDSEDEMISESVSDVKHSKEYSKVRIESVLESLNIPYGIVETEEGYRVDISGDLDSVMEAEVKNANDAKIRNILYQDRMKTPTDVINIYNKIKESCSQIEKTFIYLDKYRDYNLIMDFFYYLEDFYKNIHKVRGDFFVQSDLFLDFISRFLKDPRLSKYKEKTVIVPVHNWSQFIEKELGEDYRDKVGILSILTRLLKRDPNKVIQKLGGLNFVFVGKNAYFKCDLADLEITKIPRFIKMINNLTDAKYIPEEIPENMASNTTSALVDDVVSSIEKTYKTNIDNLEGTSGDKVKDELVKSLNKNAAETENVDDLMDKLEQDPKFKELLINLYTNDESNGVKMNAVRKNRMAELEKGFLEKELNGKKVKDIIYNDYETMEELPSTKLNLETVNEGWEDLKFINYGKSYDNEADIVESLLMLNDTSYPVAVRNMKIENTSTSEDYVDTYTVELEDSFGKRFTLKFDVPKFKDGKFMLLKGNEKTISGQLVLLPIIKTDVDTVQIVSNYNKIFIRRFGNKASSTTDKFIKVLNKYSQEELGLKCINRDCHMPNKKFNVDYDYYELSKSINKIETKDAIYYLNQVEIRDLYNAEEKDGRMPLGYDKATQTIIYNDTDDSDAEFIIKEVCDSNKEFEKILSKTPAGKSYMYSNASVLNTTIPLICILGYTIGLIPAMNKAGVQFEIHEKNPSIDPKYEKVVKFRDGYLKYRTESPSQRLLMNGLTAKCEYRDYSIADINSKQLWIDVLDNFGNRSKLSDGLDNFYDLMIDPITKQVLKDYKLPTNYIDVLIYANSLLTDNSFTKDVDMRGRRYRCNELISGYVYKAIARAYEEYKLQAKRGRKDATMSMKQSAAIDQILIAPTCSDASILNALLDGEMVNTVNYKGLSGMNGSRGFNVEKRAYDPSMINVLGMSTNFAGNVGVVRQTTIDMNIKGKRGYIKVADNLDDMSVTKSLTLTEAMIPYSSTRDDPMRVAMGFVQMSNHQMRTAISHPQLITNGADQALPYIVSNNFAFKSKESGVVTEIKNDYMVVKYDNGKSDFIDLRKNIKKNSNGGFFVPLKLDTDLKVGDKFQANDVLAYDRLSFRKDFGASDNLAYNAGIMAKCVCVNSDDGFEDSCIVSDWFSRAAAKQVVIKKDISLPKNTEILHIVKKGDPVEEGDSILVFQNAYEDEDANMLMKILSGDQESVNEIGRIPIKSKVTGFVDDVKIYRTVELDELSESMRKLCESIEAPVKKMKKVMDQNDIEWANTIEPTYALPATGKLKNSQDGVLIEIYLRYDENLGNADKIVFFNALKGVDKTIIPKGLEPRSEFRPEERCDTILSLGSVNGRMTGAIITNGLINKGIIELTRTCKDILGIKWDYLNAE